MLSDNKKLQCHESEYSSSFQNIMASHLQRIASSLLILFSPGTFPFSLLPILSINSSLNSHEKKWFSVNRSPYRRNYIPSYLFPSAYTVPRLFPCSCIILFSPVLLLIYQGCQFFTGLLLKIHTEFPPGEGWPPSDMNYVHLHFFWKPPQLVCSFQVGMFVSNKLLMKSFLQWWGWQKETGNSISKEIMGTRQTRLLVIIKALVRRCLTELCCPEGVPTKPPTPLQGEYVITGR